MFRSIVAKFAKTNYVMSPACEKKIENKICSTKQIYEIPKDILERMLSQEKELSDVKQQLITQQKKIKEILDLIEPKW